MKQKNDAIFQTVVYTLTVLICLVTVYPLIYVISASFSDPARILGGDVVLWPVDITLNAYKRVFSSSDILTGYRNTVIYTFFGTIVNMFFTIICAYPLSLPDLKGKNAITIFITFTMFFGGGMIPTYLVINQMNLLNTIWAVVLPGAITTQHVIIVRTFFQSIPSEMVEAAAIDGATNFKVFLKIILPLSKAVVAVIVLYVASSLWNGYFGPMIYLTDQNLYPLQLFLRQILLQNDMQGVDISAAAVAEQQETAQLIKYGVIIVSTVPMMILYPFVQKYFVKGVMVGSLKG